MSSASYNGKQNDTHLKLVHVMLVVYDRYIDRIVQLLHDICATNHDIVIILRENHLEKLSVHDGENMEEFTHVLDQNQSALEISAYRRSTSTVVTSY